MADYTLASSNVSYAEPVPGLYVVRITDCQNNDTLTFPVKSIIGIAANNETTANVLKVARTTATKVTISCTNNDEVGMIVYATK